MDIDYSQLSEQEYELLRRFDEFEQENYPDTLAEEPKRPVLVLVPKLKS
jgi:hypothetical protein